MREVTEEERLAELARADAAAVLDDDVEADEAAQRAAAAQKLTELTEELGLYDTGDEPEVPLLSSHPSHCPFCGVPIGTHADWESKCHRPGG